MRKIKSIDVLISGPEGGINNYSVGNQVNGLKIAEIRDLSNEYPDSRDSYYQCCDESGQPIVSFDNCPVVVEWYEENK